METELKVRTTLKNATNTFITKLYANNLLPRSLIQEIIQNVTTLLNAGHIEIVKKMILSRLIELGGSRYIDSIDTLFNDIQKPFLEFATDYKRLKNISISNGFISAKDKIIGHKFSRKNKDNNVELETVAIYEKFVSLRKILSNIFSSANFYENMIEYCKKLQNNNTVITNFIQSNSWKNTVSE